MIGSPITGAVGSTLAWTGPFTVPRLKDRGVLATRSVAAQKFSRPAGEVVWRHPLNRLVLPPPRTKPLPITAQIEGGRTEEFLWNDKFGFCPGGVQARFVSAAATTVQLMWAPDADTAGKLEPLLPFHDPFVEMNARAIGHELESAAPDALFIESLGHAIVTKILRRFVTQAVVEAPQHSGLSRERLRRVRDYIDAHLSDDLTLDAIAEVACLSPYHLSRSFRRATGIGLHRYVTYCRIDKAKDLVLNTDLPVALIAMNVGFESPAAFATRFRQIIGQSPSSLRRS